MREVACSRVGFRPMAREYQRRKLDCLVEHLEVDLVAIEGIRIFFFGEPASK